MVCNRDLEVARPEYRFNCFSGAVSLVDILGLATSDSRIFKLLVWVLAAFIMFVVCKVCNRDLEVARPKNHLVPNLFFLF